MSGGTVDASAGAKWDSGACLSQEPAAEVLCSAVDQAQDEVRNQVLCKSNVVSGSLSATHESSCNARTL